MRQQYSQETAKKLTHPYSCIESIVCYYLDDNSNHRVWPFTPDSQRNSELSLCLSEYLALSVSIKAILILLLFGWQVKNTTQVNTVQV